MRKNALPQLPNINYEIASKKDKIYTNQIELSWKYSKRVIQYYLQSPLTRM